MKIILTHEHADFDAFASQLAAHKLDPDATPVLPRNLNQNVRDFWMLYRGVLPHITAEELSGKGGRRRLESVTVVDTSSFSTIRGMRPDTPVHVIDHHPPPESLPPHHTFSGEQLGATATILVEQIQKASISLSRIEATLLMLGIYEDTGSLLYGTTTARDVGAAAWLMTQGGDLSVVGKFLQHPLNDEQRRLYDLWAASMVVREIAGHTVLIASAEVSGIIEEISTVAQKLRELVDPSALFALVKMGSQLRLVARSAVDEIDVGYIAVQLGGGGHRRAAAALIEGGDLDQIQAKLEALLEATVQPSATVADLMSWGMQTVPADERIETAAEEMHRLGYEGYPVIESGKLVGLLTRRAVDRALIHRMGGYPVTEVMESGQVVAHPTDSIHHLQQKMIQSGWGQIPVVDDDGALIGIVTRTDLINHWGQPDNGVSRRAEIAERLENTLSPGLWALVRAISKQAQAMNLGLYLIGGFARDLLLSRPDTDLDLVVEGDAIGLVRTLVAHFGGSMHKHDQFGTATWFLDEAVVALFGAGDDWPPSVDFATARTEFYESPTALPTVIPRGSIKSDLHRRDFSINALAIRLSPEPFGQLLDFWGGERDMQTGLIRVLHSLSFIDDPTRILRAARFEQRFGFHIEDRTLRLIEHALPLLERVSGPRIRHEIEVILREPYYERALRRLQTLGVLDHISPQLKVNGWLYAAIEALRYAQEHPPWPEVAALSQEKRQWIVASFVVFTCRLDAEEANRLGQRLQVRRKTLDAMLDGIKSYHEIVPTLCGGPLPSEVSRLLSGLSQVGLVVAWAITPTKEARDLITRYITIWRAVRHTLTPEDISALGIKPGPAYGRLLRRLRDAWLDGEVSTPEEEQKLAMRLIAEGDIFDDGPGR